MLRKLLSITLVASLTATLSATAASEKAGAKETAPVRLNRASFEFAKSLIEEGHVVTDSDKPWSASAPTPEDANHFIGKHGWPQYGKWHLGVSESLRETTKHRYSFPFGDFTNVYRSALVAAKARAVQYHHNDIRDAASELLALAEKHVGPPAVATPTPHAPEKKTEKKK